MKQKSLEEALREQADKLAQAELRKLSSFLAALAHELRSPLAPVLSCVHIARLTADASQREQALDTIQRQLLHLSRLLDNLLEVARVSTGRIQLYRERLDLAQLIRTAAEDHRPVLEEAGLALSVETPETPVWVFADATRLTQILHNLLDNAIRFKGGGSWVIVRVRADQDHRQAVLSVCDDGAGVDAQLLPRLWYLFSQADQGLQRAVGGLGLGLALVRSLAELHGGQVEATSAGPGRGAEFSVRLAMDQEPPALSEKRAAAGPARKALRILVIEDNQDAAESLRLLLQLLGHEVTVTHTGVEGVHTAQHWRPNLVLSDIGLPGGLDGWGVARELRQNPATAQTRLIAITGYGREEDKRRAKEVGFDYLLTKPADPDMLLQLIGC
jgi:CheY-like chemotaxis protein/nitrogen-specific signal transduction histidine kinase